MINFDIKIGYKEIVAVAVSIPIVYKKLLKIKSKYGMKAPQDCLCYIGGNRERDGHCRDCKAW